MDRDTIDAVLDVLVAKDIRTLDLTGGAPELNPHFRDLVSEARARGVHVIDRCNLTILFEPGQEDLAEFLAAHQVEIVASLPCYSQDNVDRQRGKGVFDKSIRALQRLNALGYGRAERLPLSLVYNPQGPSLPPPQAALEADYRRLLGENFGIVFTRLSRSPTCRSSASARRSSPRGSSAPTWRCCAARTAREPRAGDVPHRWSRSTGRATSTTATSTRCSACRCGKAMPGKPARAAASGRLARAGPRRATRSSLPTTATAARPGRARAAAARLADGARTRADAPGRTCPPAYRYSPRVFARAADISADTLYVVGGLYGNVQALDAIERMAAQEAVTAALVFNGDFHWFDAEPAAFAEIQQRVLAPPCAARQRRDRDRRGRRGGGLRLRLPRVRSRRRRRALQRDPRAAARARGAVPGQPRGARRAADARGRQVGDARVGIVHGDASSLAGWGFAHDAPARAARHDAGSKRRSRWRRWTSSPSSHTCRAGRSKHHGTRLRRQQRRGRHAQLRGTTLRRRSRASRPVRYPRRSSRSACYGLNDWIRAAVHRRRAAGALRPPPGCAASSPAGPTAPPRPCPTSAASLEGRDFEIDQALGRAVSPAPPDRHQHARPVREVSGHPR